MSSMFAFLKRSATSRADLGAREESEGKVAIAATSPAVQAPAISLDIDLDLKRVVQRMLDELSGILPAAGPNLPVPVVIVLKLADAPVGVGNFIGEEARQPLGRASIKGGRFDATVRFILWGASAPPVNDDMLAVQSSLLSALPTLWNLGFLRLAALDSSNPEFDTTLNAWRRTADYSVLYEYRYESADSADSLIVRIPVRADQEIFHSANPETTVVTDDMARWDNLAAPRLAMRGPANVAGLSALMFTAMAMPGGPVTLLRTFDGAAGPAPVFSSLATFLAAQADPVAPARHAAVTFSSFTDFLAQFSSPGAPSHLGDWDLDDTPDQYQGRELVLVPPVRLDGVFDRLEISYGNGSQPLDQVAVVYLRLW